MSFRYISALPTCLHGRPITRTAYLSSSFSFCRRCSSGLAQAVTAEHYQYGQRDLKVSNNTHDQRYRPNATYKQRRTSASRQQSSERNATLEQALNSSKPGSTSTTTSNPAVRIGTVLDVPGFIKESGYWVDKEPTKEEKDAESTLEEQEDLPVIRKIEVGTNDGCYKRWETLHDEFLEVRRKRPSETDEVFKEQRAFAKRFLNNSTSVQVSALEFKRKWLDLGDVEQSKVLPDLLIGSLTESAASTLFVLSNIDRIPYSFLIRMNCLRSLRIMYLKTLQQNSELMNIYEGLIEKLRSPDMWPTRKLPNVLLQNLLFWSTPEQCQKIIRDFLIKYPDAESSATIIIIDHYLRIEDREQAFENFKKLPEALLREPDAIVIGLRDRLLKLDCVAETETGTNFKYLPQILALGVPSDEALHNTVIESAILNKMPDVAWDVYQYLENSRFQSNARSHLVLLRDSFLRGDVRRVNELMTTMHSREDLLSDQYLLAYAMNIVRNISCYEKRLGPDEAQSHIMALYDRVYDRSPLIRLGITQPISNRPSLQQPSPTLLAFTIWSYILVQRHNGRVLSLWEWLKYLIANGDSAVRQAATNDVIYNGLVLYHARTSENLFRSMDVVQYMLSGDLCRPTSRTWSILVCAFLRHGQKAQAERLLAMMQSRGYKVEEIAEQYGEYIPEGYDLRSMAANVSTTLDERKIPEGLEELMATSGSATE